MTLLSFRVCVPLKCNFWTSESSRLVWLLVWRCFLGNRMIWLACPHSGFHWSMARRALQKCGERNGWHPGRLLACQNFVTASITIIHQSFSVCWKAFSKCSSQAFPQAFHFPQHESVPSVWWVWTVAAVAYENGLHPQCCPTSKW